MKYQGIVKWNGNHYFSGETVIGSEIKTEDNKMYLYDDDESYISGIGDMTRYEWVEIEKESLKELKNN